MASPKEQGSASMKQPVIAPRSPLYSPLYSPMSGTPFLSARVSRSPSIDGGDRHGRTLSMSSARHGFSGRPVYESANTSKLEIPREQEQTEEEETLTALPQKAPSRRRHSPPESKLETRPSVPRALSSFSNNGLNDADIRSIVSGATTPTVRRSLDPSIRPSSMKGARADLPWIGTFAFESNHSVPPLPSPQTSVNAQTNSSQSPFESGFSDSSEDGKHIEGRSRRSTRRGEKHDANLVEFEDSDPGNPQEWSTMRRWIYTIRMSFRPNVHRYCGLTKHQSWDL